MQIFTSLEHLTLEPSVATIGFFDGVHKGHQYVLEQLKIVSLKKKLKTLVITFDKHPREIIQEGFQMELLTTLEEKIALIKSQKIDYCLVLPFDKTMAELTAEKFMKEILYQQLSISTLLIGFNHKFGKDRTDNFIAYQQYGREIGMEVKQLQEIFNVNNNFSLSSSMIRIKLKEGQMFQVTEALGRTYTIQGKVVEGNKIGRTIGFPTANIAFIHSQKLVPPCGVYVVKAMVGEAYIEGVLNIGYRPTIVQQEKQRTLEVHLFNFSDDIYNKETELYFYSFLRPEKRFASLEELKLQIQKDVEQAKSFFEQNHLY